MDLKQHFGDSHRRSCLSLVSGRFALAQYFFQMRCLHKNLIGNYPPTKIFDRTSNLAGHQIINYSSDITQKWLLLVGITLSNNRVVGAMQMYSVEKNVSQPIEGHCGAFTRVTLPGASAPSTLFSFANKGEAGAKVSLKGTRRSFIYFYFFS